MAFLSANYGARMNPIAATLARFLESDDQSTLLVHGKWGVGKSYAIKSFLDSHAFAEVSIIARSTVSLFGRQSLGEIQRDIFALAAPVASADIIKKKMGAIAGSYLRLDRYADGYQRSGALRVWLSKAGLIQVPWLGSIGALLSHGNYDLIRNFLVVIDDLERRSKGVALKDVLHHKGGQVHLGQTKKGGRR
jgi:hypothetical protein